MFKLVFSVIGSVAVLCSCGGVVYSDVSAEKPYDKLIGKRFETVAVVAAYGIRRHSAASIEYYSIIPPPGIAGPEVGNVVSLEIGTVMTISKVLRTNRLFEGRFAYCVVLDDAEELNGFPIRVDLMRGNEGANGLDLNPIFFRSYHEPSSRGGAGTSNPNC